MKELFETTEEVAPEDAFGPGVEFDADDEGDVPLV